MARFKVKPHTEPRQPRTPAQEAATDRAFRIFRLRGLYSHACLLTGERRAAMETAIDDELVRLGVEPQGERMRVRIAAALSRVAAR